MEGDVVIGRELGQGLSKATSISRGIRGKRCRCDIHVQVARNTAQARLHIHIDSC